MRTLLISLLNCANQSLLVLTWACLLIGCDKSVAEPGSVQKSAAIATQSGTQANKDVDESTTAKPGINGCQHGAGLAINSDSSAFPKNEKSVSLEVNAPLAQSGQSNSAPPTAEVDHNDPTSYPVTIFTEKQAGQILMLSWNVESEGAEADTICKALTKLNAEDRYDVIALTEVLPEDFGKFSLAMGDHYKYAHSKSGRNDRLQILYNENKFEKVRHFEVDKVNISGRYRAPLVVHLKERKTQASANEVEFLVMVNHLARGKEKIRQQQATLLVEWAREQNLPVFALGDYNFDYVFATEQGNPAFVNFMRDNIWRWVKPMEMVDNNWFDNPKEPDGKDDYLGSMLDFAFVAGPAKDWKSSCQIIVRENDFPDDEKTSDHRPYELRTEK